MDAIFWKSANLKFVELLWFDGQMIGTRSHSVKGESFLDKRYPEVQRIIVEGCGFLEWMQKNNIPWIKKDLTEPEYLRISGQPSNPWNSELF